MAKASSPVRLDKDLMSAATEMSSLFNRSAAEQVEYWADLGGKVSKVLDPEVLLEVSAGLRTLKVEDTAPVSIDPDAVFDALDQERESGALSQAIAANSVRYQASLLHQGYLEQVHPDGSIVVGQFVEGEFEPLQL